MAPDVARLALGVVNAYFVGEVGGPWVLVDAPSRLPRIPIKVQSGKGYRT